jgi:hypothetical protein
MIVGKTEATVVEMVPDTKRETLQPPPAAKRPMDEVLTARPLFDPAAGTVKGPQPEVPQ